MKLQLELHLIGARAVVGRYGEPPGLTDFFPACCEHRLPISSVAAFLAAVPAMGGEFEGFSFRLFHSSSRERFQVYLTDPPGSSAFPLAEVYGFAEFSLVRRAFDILRR